MSTVLRIVNRVLLGVVGLALVVLGGSVLAIGLGVRSPSWWIHDGPHDVLLSDAERTRWRDQGWWWPAVIAGLAVLVLLALWWLAAVLRRAGWPRYWSTSVTARARCCAAGRWRAYSPRTPGVWTVSRTPRRS